MNNLKKQSILLYIPFVGIFIVVVLHFINYNRFFKTLKAYWYTAIPLFLGMVIIGYIDGYIVRPYLFNSDVESLFVNLLLFYIYTIVIGNFLIFMQKGNLDNNQ